MAKKSKKNTKKPLLILGGFNDYGFLHYFPENLGREVKLVLDIKEASAELKANPDKYSAFLIEPSIYSQRETEIHCLQGFMQHTRSNGGLAVVIFSNRDEIALNQEFQLYHDQHYDAYVCKMEIDPGSNLAQRLSKTLDGLLTPKA